jgi:hypothetical protein
VQIQFALGCMILILDSSDNSSISALSLRDKLVLVRDRTYSYNSKLTVFAWLLCSRVTSSKEHQILEAVGFMNVLLFEKLLSCFPLHAQGSNTQ